MVRTRTIALAAVATLVLALGSACHSPLKRTSGGDFVTTGEDRTVVAREGVGKQIALYLPNRIIDAVDIIHLGFGLDAGLLLDLRITRWGQLALLGGATAGWAWDGRDHDPNIHTAYWTAAFGPWRTGSGVGHGMPVQDWEIAYAGPFILGIGTGKIAVDLSEILDFALGVFFIDILEDDYGWTTEADLAARADN